MTVTHNAATSQARGRLDLRRQLWPHCPKEEHELVPVGFIEG